MPKSQGQAPLKAVNKLGGSVCRATPRQNSGYYRLDMLKLKRNKTKKI